MKKEDEAEERRRRNSSTSPQCFFLFFPFSSLSVSSSSPLSLFLSFLSVLLTRIDSSLQLHFSLGWNVCIVTTPLATIKENSSPLQDSAQLHRYSSSRPNAFTLSVGVNERDTRK